MGPAKDTKDSNCLKRAQKTANAPKFKERLALAEKQRSTKLPGAPAELPKALTCLKAPGAPTTLTAPKRSRGPALTLVKTQGTNLPAGPASPALKATSPLPHLHIRVNRDSRKFAKGTNLSRGPSSLGGTESEVSAATAHVQDSVPRCCAAPLHCHALPYPMLAQAEQVVHLHHRRSLMPSFLLRVKTTQQHTPSYRSKTCSFNKRYFEV